MLLNVLKTIEKIKFAVLDNTRELRHIKLSMNATGANDPNQSADNTSVDLLRKPTRSVQCLEDYSLLNWMRTDVSGNE